MDRNEIEELIERLERDLEKERNRTCEGDPGLNDSNVEDAARALRHLLQAQRWRPISEAPKDGTWFLAFYPKNSDDCFQDQWKPAKWVENFFNEGYPGFMDAAEFEEFDQPTHWLPLPQPPSTDEEPKATPSEQQNDGDA